MYIACLQEPPDGRQGEAISIGLLMREHFNIQARNAVWRSAGRVKKKAELVWLGLLQANRDLYLFW